MDFFVNYFINNPSEYNFIYFGIQFEMFFYTFTVPN